MPFHHTWCQQVSCTLRELYRDAGWGQLVESEPWERNKPEQAGSTPFPELLLLMTDPPPPPWKLLSSNMPPTHGLGARSGSQTFLRSLG